MLESILVQIAVLLVTVLIMAVLGALRSYLKSRLTAQQYAILEGIVEAAVWAVEQRKGTVFANKKDKAIEIIKSNLAARGLEFTDEEIDARLESQVAMSFNYDRIVNTKEMS